MTVQTIYRIENEDTEHGMWYRSDGTYDPFIFRLTEGKSRDLPMELDGRYGQQGLRWVSGGDTIEKMNHWFSPLDALELHKNGYKLFQFESVQFQLEEFQVIFTREGIISKQEIPLDVVWNLDSVR